MAGYADDLALAHLLADTADSISMARFRALDLHVESKPDLTPVSDADTAVEKAIRATLARARPRDGVLGEEYGMSAPAAGAGNRQWEAELPVRVLLGGSRPACGAPSHGRCASTPTALDIGWASTAVRWRRL